MRLHSPLARGRLGPMLAGAGLLLALLLTAAALSSGSASARSGSQGAVAADPPSNTSLPAVSGTAVVGQTLSATSGSWAGDTPITYAYQWRRCDTGGANCNDITGATGPTRTLTSDDADHTLRVQVTASNAFGSAAALSAATATVTSNTVPVVTSDPVITGSLVEGQTITTSQGTWSSATPITGYAYQWVRCPDDGGAPDGSNCTVIGGATAAGYTLQGDDVGRRLRSRVTATNGAGSQTAASNATGPVAALTGSTGAPRNTKEPTVSGTAQQGLVLNANPGAWSGSSPITYSYQWLRCDQNGNGCALLAGQTNTTFVPGSGELNRRVRVQVTARNSLGTATATSNPTSAITASAGAPPVPGGLPSGAIRLPDGRYSIPVTSVSLPDRLVADRVQFSPNPVRSRSSAISVRVHVVDTRGYVVREATVFVRSTPLVTTSPGEQRTDQDGWATIAVSPRASFPLRAGFSVQFFIRVRKAGDDPLAGVSVRRLVQVRTARG